MQPHSMTRTRDITVVSNVGEGREITEPALNERPFCCYLCWLLPNSFFKLDRLLVTLIERCWLGESLKEFETLRLRFPEVFNATVRNR